MTMINGAKHDVEDILASIRTSIADRSPFEAEKREAQVTTLRGRSAIAEEAMEFELPAIFKAPSPSAPERPNLLGRLSEALSSSAQHNAEHTNWQRSRTVIPFEPSHGRMIEPPPPVVLEAVKEMPENTGAAEKISQENDSVKRVMPTFFDTRMNRMAEMTRAPDPVPSAPVQPVQRNVPLLGSPVLPEPSAVSVGDGTVEDAAAQLLRPILKQWLTENMPKIVEKALRDETGRS